MQKVYGQACSDSVSFVHTESTQGRRIFFYPLCVGASHYRGYFISRTSFDSFLIMLVTEGTLTLQTGEGEYTAKVGDVVAVDCYRPHCYGTFGECRLMWLHFDGPQAREYYQLATAGGPVIRPVNASSFRYNLEQLLEIFRRKGQRREADLSCRIIQLMTELMESAQHERSADAIETAVARIAEDPAAPLTLDALAEYVSLSPYYFCRRFREKMGLTPHEYLLQVRVDRARYLLRSSDFPLKEIAESCGFSNPSSFSNTFRRLTGTTPLTYRREGNPKKKP